MTVKELKSYLSDFSDETEILQHRREDCYPLYKLEDIFSSSSGWNFEDKKFTNTKEKLIIDVSQ